MRSNNASMNVAAVSEGAPIWASSTSHPEMTCLSVKCFSTTSGSGLTSNVSTFRKSPGASATYYFGFFTAYGRFLWRFLADIRLHIGSHNNPRSFSRRNILPTIDAASENRSSRSITTSLSLPHQGYYSLSVRIVSTISAEHSGLRVRLGRWEHSSGLSRYFSE